MPVVTMAEDAGTSITIDCGAGVSLGSTSEAATEFWFCVPPTAFAEGFTITATNTAGAEMTKSVSSSKTITRNVRNQMAPLQASFKVKKEGLPFVDKQFKEYCVGAFDTDGDGEICYDELDAVKVIDVVTTNIKTLEDISYFYNLEKLRCSGDGRGGLLTSLDLRSNRKLTELDCSDNRIGSLDLSRNTALTKVNCSLNDLATLDVYGLSSLTELDCSHNLITSLDLRGVVALTRLDCSDNKLTELDVMNCEKLLEMYCNSNRLTFLDVENCLRLRMLYCRNNPDLPKVYYSGLPVVIDADCTAIAAYAVKYFLAHRRLDANGEPLPYRSSYVNIIDAADDELYTGVNGPVLQYDSTLDLSEDVDAFVEFPGSYGSEFYRLSDLGFDGGRYSYEFAGKDSNGREITAGDGANAPYLAEDGYTNQNAFVTLSDGILAVNHAFVPDGRAAVNRTPLVKVVYSIDGSVMAECYIKIIILPAMV